MGNVAIRVEGVGKQYRIGGPRVRYHTLREQMMQALAAPLRKLRGGGNNGKGMIWALRNVSFEVKRGEIIGIIGRNGAGKSTLLKILSRVTDPTTGEVDMYGRVGSLLEVGTGFNPELTGRENVYLNGAILGMRRAEIARKFEEIVEFAEVGKYLDTPVKHYSSGMYMRLAFAVAAHLEAEILVVDEVLAVGDTAFQKKCLGKMGEVARDGRTVLFVSHNMMAVNRLCPQSIWLDAGALRLQGATRDVMGKYLASDVAHEAKRVWEGGIANPGEKEFQLLEVSILNSAGQVTARLNVRETFRVQIRYRICGPIPHCAVGFVFTNAADYITVFESHNSDNLTVAERLEQGEYLATCEVPGSFLRAGDYVISLNAAVPMQRHLMSLQGVLCLTLEDDIESGAFPGWPQRRWGVVCPRLDWSSKLIETETCEGGLRIS